MTNISDIITDVIAGKTTIEAIPENIRERVQNGIRVRQARHEGHSTTNNPDGTITAVNDRLRVTLPESEFISREHVFTTAMRVLAHRSETKQPIS